MENFDEIVERARRKRKMQQNARLKNFVALLRAGFELKLPQLYPAEKEPTCVCTGVEGGGDCSAPISYGACGAIFQYAPQ